MIRAIALSLVFLFGIGFVIPLTSDYVEAGPKKQRKYTKKKKKKIKKYSKKWWRLYRARMKRKKALQARKRSLRLRQIRLARQYRLNKNRNDAINTRTTQNQEVENNSPAILPTGKTAPKTWKKSQASPTELQFQVSDENGLQLGLASIAVVGPSMGNDDNNGRVKTIGGVPVTSLRRNVIDQMIRENGWVVNDFQKEIGGKRVYVVVAQSEGRNGMLQSRMFYFTEVDGKIYSVSTNAPNASSEKIAAESEKVIDSLMRNQEKTQQAGLNK
jgi:hypothetical protein